jgi:catechol 2,3-dioxygenase-like lactoylglutathione lyase family enzyme
MFTIGRNFHVIHMTDDLAALGAWYEDVFGIQWYVIHNYSPELHRHASLGVIGELCIEPMQPAFEDDGWNRGPIGRYYERSGIGWHSIAWYLTDVEGLTELRDGLEANDVELLGLLGGKLEHDPDAQEDRPIFTHPNSTVTQLEFMVPHPWIPDPRPHPAFTTAWWHESHPLHLRKTSHFTLATRDLDRARDLYVDVIGGTLLQEGENDLLHARSAYIAVGRDDVVELAQPLDAGTPIADYVEAEHHGLFAVWLQVEDLADATAHLTSKQVAPCLDDGTSFLSDPATTMGVHWGVTTAAIPGDTRADW